MSAGAPPALRVAILGLGRLGTSMLERIGSPACSHRLEVVATWRRGEAMPTKADGVDVYYLCVSDGAVAEVASLIPTLADHGGRGGEGTNDVPVLHASGALDHEVLRPHRPAGSLHPLQSFPGPDVALPPLDGVPAAVAGDEAAIEVATRMAEGLGMVPFRVSGDRRLYHAAAVMAGNFTTTIMAEASRVLASAGVDEREAPKILAPLAMAAIRNAASSPSPVDALTGPFPRGDTATIAAHLEALTEAHGGGGGGSKGSALGVYHCLGRATASLLVDEGRLSEEVKAELDYLVELSAIVAARAKAREAK